MKTYKKIVLFFLLTIGAGAVFGEFVCPANPPKGLVLIYENQFEPGWSVSGAWSSTTVTEVQTPGQSVATEKSLLLHYPIAWGGTGLYESSYSAYIGGRTSLDFRVRMQNADGGVFVGLHRVAPYNTVPVWIDARDYLSSNQSAQFLPGQWYSISIPLSVLGVTETFIQGVVFQSNIVGDVWVDDVGFTSPIVMKWPLGVNNTGRAVTSPFGDDWNNTYCGGLIKKHNGTDYSATAGWPVYAVESGVVKDKHFDSSGTWAWNVVIEHTTTAGQKYTTVSWHINPLVNIGQSVIKGQTQIGTVADLSPYGNDTHFHFGVRLGAYTENVSGAGGLPQNDCDIYPAFPAGFVDPNDTRNVLFQ